MIPVAYNHIRKVPFVPFGKILVITLMDRRIDIVAPGPLVFAAFPFVKGFVHDQKAQLIAEVIEFFHMGVMANPYGVAAGGLEFFEPAPPYVGPDRGAQTACVMVNANAPYLFRLSVEKKAFAGIKMEEPYAYVERGHQGHKVFPLIPEFQDQGIKPGIIRGPELRPVDSKGQFKWQAETIRRDRHYDASRMGRPDITGTGFRFGGVFLPDQGADPQDFSLRFREFSQDRSGYEQFRGAVSVFGPYYQGSFIYYNRRIPKPYADLAVYSRSGIPAGIGCVFVAYPDGDDVGTFFKTGTYIVAKTGITAGSFAQITTVTPDLAVFVHSVEMYHGPFPGPGVKNRPVPACSAGEIPRPAGIFPGKRKRNRPVMGNNNAVPETVVKRRNPGIHGRGIPRTFFQAKFPVLKVQGFQHSSKDWADRKRTVKTVPIHHLSDQRQYQRILRLFLRFCQEKFEIGFS
jgi:hypothetical protein